MNDSESSDMQIAPSDRRNALEEHFLSLFERYQDPIFRFLYFRVQNRPVALDITQDTFTRTWVYLSSGNVIVHEEAFLYRAARNALIDYFKKSKSASLDTLMEGGYDPATDNTVASIEKADDAATLRALMRTLDEESKQIIFLRFTEEKPIEEIADIYGKTVNAMTVQIHRIIRKLRGKFTDSTTYYGS